MDPKPVLGEVWQDADGVCLVFGGHGRDGGSPCWWAFGVGELLPGDHPGITYPLRRLLDTMGEIVPERLA